jgi:hypothetical protein
MTSVTAIQPTTAASARAFGRSTRASSTESAAPAVSAAAAPVVTSSTRHASTRPASRMSESSSCALRRVLAATSMGTATTQNHGSTMNTASPYRHRLSSGQNGCTP